MKTAAFFVATIVALTAAQAQTPKLKFVSSGIASRVGGFVPQHIFLSSNPPAELKKAPADLTAPFYGTLKLGPTDAPTTFVIIVDAPEGKPSRLFADANANGDLTDDAPADWKARTNKFNGHEYVSYSGGATLMVHYGEQTFSLHLPMYDFAKNDPQHPGLDKMLFYYSDYGWAGPVNVGSKFYSAILADRLATGDFRPNPDPKHSSAMLFLDLNADGKFNPATEAFPVSKGFRIAGNLYHLNDVSPSGDSFEVAKAEPSAEELNAVAGFSRGNRPPVFSAKTTDGKTVAFPASYQGKIVLLDFWATWCPPCRAEIPHIAAAYQQYHARGFEVLSVSLDQPNEADTLSQFTQEHNMPWPEIYDGKYWRAEIAQLYHIESIPHAFLVDGDTGLIIAEGDALRGEALSPAISKALAKHSAQ